MRVELTKIGDFVRVLTIPWNVFLLERLVLDSVPYPVAHHIAVRLCGLRPFEFNHVRIFGQKPGNEMSSIGRFRFYIDTFISSCYRSLEKIYPKNVNECWRTYFTLTWGLLGTPPGVLTVSGGERSPSPFLVRAATCTEYVVSGCNPVMFTSSTSSRTSRRIGSFSRSFPWQKRTRCCSLRNFENSKIREPNSCGPKKMRTYIYTYIYLRREY